MRDVIVVGGGLSGLVAAYELEKRGLDISLIEVKPRLGGSINTVTENGFVIDTGPFVLADTFDHEWLAALGLEDAVLPHTENTIILRDGSVMLIDALARSLSGPRLLRMAVSSIGELEHGHLGVCLENGLLFDARAVIVTVSARWAARMFYSLQPTIAAWLETYRYDTLHRVALGYPTDALPPIEPPPDVAFAFVHACTHPARVPAGHTLLQFGMRFNHACDPSAVIAHIRERLNLPEPIIQRLDTWPEADPLTCYDDDHAAQVQAMREQLPANVALIGSDYTLAAPARRGVAHFEERIGMAQQAAAQIAAYVQSQSS